MALVRYLSAARTRSRISATEPTPEIFRYFGARGSPCGPTGIVIHERPRLLPVNPEALPHRLLSVVVALNERLARNVVFARHFGGIEFDVVDASRAGMYPTPAHPLNDLVLRYIDLEHEVENDAGLTHCLRL